MKFFEKFSNFIKFTLYLLKLLPFRLLSIFILTSVEGFIPIYLVVIIREIVDFLSLGGSDNQILFTLIIKWIVIMTLQFTVGIIIRYLVNTFYVLASEKSSEVIVSKSMELQGIGNVESKGFQDIYYSISDSGARIENFINNFRFLVRNCVSFISVLILFITISVWVPIIVFISIIPGFFITIYKSKKIELNDELIYELERKSNFYRNYFINPKSFMEFKIFKFPTLIKDKYREFSDDMVDRGKKLNRTVAFLDLLSVLPRIIMCGLIIIYFALRTVTGEVTIGEMTLFIGSIFQLSNSLSEIITFWSYLSDTLLFFDKFQKFLNIKDSIKLTGTEKIDTIDSIEFINVSFGYDDYYVIKNVSFKITKGEPLALVGANGAGKSTIIKLILRLYDPNEGLILVNGKDIQSIDIKSLRDNISGVFQDYQKYALTIKDNIWGSYKNGKIDDLNSTVDIDFINRYKDGLNTLLGKELGGTELSGGQWQKLAILRGLAKKFSVLLVDEPTSSIDPIQEVEIYESLLTTDANIKILVTHRLGSIKYVKNIVVLKNGRVVEQGSHEELMKAEEFYYKLYSSQSEMYQTN